MNPFRSSGEREHSYTLWGQVRVILLSSWIGILLIPAIPAGFAVKYTDQSAIATFVVNFVAIIPLGRILDIVTEELTIRMGGHDGMVIVVTFRHEDISHLNKEST